MPRPIILILASYLSGLISGYYLEIPFHILIASVFILTSLTAASILVKKFPTLFFIFSLLTLALLGIARMEALLHPVFPENDITNFISDEPLSLEGRICEPPDRLQDKTRLYIVLSTLYTGDTPHSVTGKLLLTIGDKGTGLGYLDTIRFLAKVKRPRNFHNPGGFDYERHLALRGVFATAFLKDGEGIIKTSDGKRSFRNRVEEVRDAIRGNAFKNGGSSAPVLLALITGEQGEITKEVRDAFSKAGTAHILAISGEHIGLIAIISFSIFIRLFKRSERLMLTVNIYKAAALMTIPGIILYSFIAGAGFSIMRAAVMGGCALIAVLFDRRKDIPSLVAFAAFLILAFEPEALFDISFQLSFASVISIAMILPYLERAYLLEDDGIENSGKWIYRFCRWLKPLFLTTIAATLGTAPIVAFYFNRASLISPISNIITVPIVGFIIVPIGLLSSLLLPVLPPLSGWLISINSILISLILRLTMILASFPSSSIRIVTPNLFEMTVFYLFILLFIYRKAVRHRVSLMILITTLILSLESFFLLRPSFQKDLRVTFLDVGQGESALIQFPAGKTMLIDGGGMTNSDFDVGERVVASFLWYERIGKIDYLVLSHPNSDHYGGLPFILRNFRVGEVWESGIEEGSKGYADFKRAAQESKAMHRRLSDGDGFIIEGTTVDVLNPPKGYEAKDDRAANNGSLVIKIRHGDASFLFTGDIEKEAEHFLLSKGSILKTTVIKAPHHGSLTSSTVAFLDLVRPEKVVFSVGYRNRFGFPKEQVIKRYRDITTETYRTDKDGAITAVSNGKNIRLSKSLISSSTSPLLH